MPVDALAVGLMLGGWVVAFLLGKQLQTGYAAWRERTSESSRWPRS